MVKIIAENKEIERCIERLYTLTKENGGTFAENIILKESGGDLTIEAPPSDKRQPLIRVHHDSLAPVEKFKLSIVNDEFVIKSHEPDIPPQAVKIMETILELYNLTKKVPQHIKTSPWIFLMDKPEILALVKRGRNVGNILHFEQLMSEGKREELIIDSFLRTRTLGYRNKRDTEPTIVLMPIIDFMNHHHRGAYFQGGAEFEENYLSIGRSPPLSEDRGYNPNECFAYYGPYDSLDTWLNYGYVDQDPPFTRSVPLDIDLQDLGILRVHSAPKIAKHKDVADPVKDLSFHLPDIGEKTDGITLASFLLIPGPRAPRSMRRVLSHVIDKIQTNHPRHEELIMRAEEQVLAANQTYYRVLLPVMTALKEKVQSKEEKNICENFITAAKIQLSRLRNYRDFSLHLAEKEAASGGGSKEKEKTKVKTA